MSDFLLVFPALFLGFVVLYWSARIYRRLLYYHDRLNNIEAFLTSKYPDFSNGFHSDFIER